MNDQESGQTVERLLSQALTKLQQGDVSGWPEMFHEDGVMEFPYAPPGNPARLGNRREIEDYMKAYPEHVRVESFEVRNTYHCPGVFVVEFRCQGHAVPTNNGFTMDYVGILTHEDGKVSRYRDYWNPLVALEAMGQADALLAKGAAK